MPIHKCRPGFTLVEMLMAMMVSGIILTCVVMLARTLSAYNGEGDATVELATHGRFVLTSVARDVRASQAAGVTASGALVLWAGDTNSDGQMKMTEFTIYYYLNTDKTVRRLTYTAGPNIGAIGSTTFNTVLAAWEAGTIRTNNVGLGLTVRNDTVCRYVDGLTFYANRAVPRTLAVEYVLNLSRRQDVIHNDGRTVGLSFYGNGTMRVPYKGGGLDPAS